MRTRMFCRQYSCYQIYIGHVSSVVIEATTDRDVNSPHKLTDTSLSETWNKEKSKRNWGLVIWRWSFVLRTTRRESAGTENTVQCESIHLHIKSIHSAAEPRASTKLCHLTLFFVRTDISRQLHPASFNSSSVASPSWGLPLLLLPPVVHVKNSLVISSLLFCNVFPDPIHLRSLSFLYLRCRGYLLSSLPWSFLWDIVCPQAPSFIW